MFVKLVNQSDGQMAKAECIRYSSAAPAQGVAVQRNRLSIPVQHAIPAGAAAPVNTDTTHSTTAASTELRPNISY